MFHVNAAVEPSRGPLLNYYLRKLDFIRESVERSHVGHDIMLAGSRRIS